MGTIAVWILFLVFCAGIILVLTKFIKNVSIDNEFVKLIVVLEFLARSSLVNVNMGHLLYQFFDKLFSFDLWFMWNIASEKGIRGMLGGKLDEYKMPILMINSNLLALAIYLASSIVTNSIKLIYKNPQTTKQLRLKTIIQNVHFLVMGATILDITFYTSIQIFKGFTITKFSGIISLVLSLIAMLSIIYDIYLMTMSIIKTKKKKTIRVSDSKGTQLNKNITDPFSQFSEGESKVKKS
jgi:hypothetical protein